MSMQTENVIDNSSSNHYSYKSEKFQCTDCSRTFNALDLGSQVAQCPRCDRYCPLASVQRQQQQQQQQQQSSQQRQQQQQQQQRPQNIFDSFFGGNSQQQQQRPNFVQMNFFNFPSQGSFFGGNSQQQQQQQQPQDVFAQFFGGSSPFFQGGSNSSFSPSQMDQEAYDRLVEEFLGNDPNEHGKPPASKDDISKLKEHKWGVDDCKFEHANCSICQDDYAHNECIQELPCSHHYHKECASKWLNMHDSCPVCRAPISEVKSN